MASAPDLWTMLCTGMALLGAARWRARIQAATTSPDTTAAPPAVAGAANPHRAQGEAAPRRSA